MPAHKSYEQRFPNYQTYGIAPSPGPVAQRTEHAPPKRGAAGSIPAGVTPPDQLRLAARENQADDREWLALRARLEFVERMVAYGVPRRIAFIGEDRLNKAKKLSPARRQRATWVITQFMLAHIPADAAVVS